MNKCRSILTVFLLFAMALPAFAQESTPQMRKKWFKEVRDYKYEFFTKEMALTKEQQDVFFPEYEAMEKAIFSVNKEARELAAKVAASKAEVSETEYEAAATALAKVKQKEGEIELEYFNKFGEILSKKQLFQLKQAEAKFTQSILSHHRNASKQQ